mgnify:CR=1 FL=1
MLVWTACAFRGIFYAAGERTEKKGQVFVPYIIVFLIALENEASFISENVRSIHLLVWLEYVVLKIEEENKPKVILKVGDRVRMKDGKAIGTIDAIEKSKATVNYGIFTSKVSLEQLEYVQPV